MPEVSVVIPAYNAARYLEDAVDSVLNQTFRSFEVLIIDDGSTDGTEALMQRYAGSVRYIRQPNGGVSRARNNGIEQSQGRYIAFLDADDVWLPEKLEKQIAALHNNPKHRSCYTALQVTSTDLTPISENRGATSEVTLDDLLLKGNLVSTPSSVICERSLLTETGGFDPELSLCADWDMWVRLAAFTSFLYLDEMLVIYRQHDSNMSRDAARLESDSVRLLEKGFSVVKSPSLRARRRAAFARNYMVLAGSYYQVGRYRDFARCAARAATLDLTQLGYLFAYPARLKDRRRTRRLERTYKGASAS